MDWKIATLHDLTPPQRAVLERLEREKSFTSCFYLTGGTLLKALGIVPRESNDLDFFTFPEMDGRAFVVQLRIVHDLLVELFGDGSIVETERGLLVKDHRMIIECVYDTVRNIDTFVSCGHLRLSGIRDLAANKSAAFCVRDELKDYVDLALLTATHRWSLLDLANMAEARFQLGTITEGKLLTEFLSKREKFALAPRLFLRDSEENVRRVEEQVEWLCNHSTL